MVYFLFSVSLIQLINQISLLTFLFRSWKFTQEHNPVIRNTEKTFFEYFAQMKTKSYVSHTQRWYMAAVEGQLCLGNISHIFSGNRNYAMNLYVFNPNASLKGMKRRPCRFSERLPIWIQ